MDVIEGDSSNEEEMMEEDETPETEAGEASKEVYLPDKELGEGEELVCDQSAYVMLHQAEMMFPCLSFDIIRDSLGDNRDNYPLTSYIVAGTQAAKPQLNNLLVVKFSNLNKTCKAEDEDDSDDDEEDKEEEEDREGSEPQLSSAFIKHSGAVNRIRATTMNNTVLAASWSELGKVKVWDLSQQLRALDNAHALEAYKKDNSALNVQPLFTFSGHQVEGYGLDWSSITPGVLATGDCKKNIHIWKPKGDGTWNVDQRPLVGHINSVEDIQWSPNEATVLASCSVDKSIRVWDIRAQPSKSCMLVNENAHERDVNVISWNKHEPFIVSGGDDGFLHVWDLRLFKEGSPVATFKHHTKSVTTVEWHPTDSAVFASGGEDDQIALWDLSVEIDSENFENEVEGVPPQLLFIHQGQKDIKELHWHSQIPGTIISTARDFNIFRTISV